MTVRIASSSNAMLSAFFTELESLLMDRAYFGGERPSLVDFAVYNPVWFYAVLGGKELPSASAKTRQWLRSMQVIASSAEAQRLRQEVDKAFAFEQATQAPRALPADNQLQASRSSVNIGPEDYGVDKVSGELVAETASRWIIKRQTNEFGDIHVHFPRRGFALS